MISICLIPVFFQSNPIVFPCSIVRSEMHSLTYTSFKNDVGKSTFPKIYCQFGQRDFLVNTKRVIFLARKKVQNLANDTSLFERSKKP